ncbi:1-aminocyclopropane-1-carboxylate synthase-like protein [Gracilaria domingensis]|nr:1-aminocyclopropane-1-carboxylate synthase-like protein [Gracilaria domingensis]
MALSSRAESLDLTLPPHVSAFFIPPYHRELRPDGPINLSVAENRLSLPLVCDALNQLPDIPPSVLSPSPKTCHPLPELLDQLVELFSTRIGHHPVDRAGFSIHSGATCAIDVLAFALCDPDEAVIITGPGYSALSRDVSALSAARPVIANSPDQEPFLSVETLDAALKSSTKRVRFAIVLSPDNPTGLIWSPTLILELAAWAQDNQLHIVFDEAYALSVYHPKAEFTSVIDMFNGKLPPHVHLVWTTSKDFCTSGLRFGVLYTQNEQLQKCASILACASPVSFISQWSFAHILSRKEWLDNYLQENARRLRGASQRVSNFLSTLDIPFCEPQAGFFVWIDLRKWIKDSTPEGEMELWQTLTDGGVILTPGNGCGGCYGSTYGFFRLCFATADHDTMTVALQRLQLVLGPKASRRVCKTVFLSSQQ